MSKSYYIFFFRSTKNHKTALLLTSPLHNSGPMAIGHALKHEFRSCFSGSPGGTSIRELSTVVKLYLAMPVMRYIANLALSALFWDITRHGAISGNLTSQTICRCFNGQFTKSWVVIGRQRHRPLIG